MKKICLLTTGILIMLTLYAQTNKNEIILKELEEHYSDTITGTVYKEQTNTDSLKNTFDNTNDEFSTPKTTNPKNSFITVEENFDETNVTIGRKAFIKVKENNDTTKIKLGKKAIKIIEDHNGAEINFIDEEDFDKEFDIEYEPDFKGHWAGLEMGINGYLTKNNSLNFEENSYMDLYANRSLNININFLEYNLYLARNNFGIVTGLGYELNDYRFERNNSITKDNEGIITELNYDSLNITLEKSKLTTSHLTIPLLLELQIPAKNKKRVFVSAGVIGGVRLGSHTKIVYKEDGRKQKDKERKDFNLSPFRYGITARIGYKALKLYATYELTPLFKKDKGPELYPFSIGFMLLSL